MNITHFNFSQRAIQSEREEKYEIAAAFWNKVAEHAKHKVNREWAEYRAELNSSRHTLHKRHEELKARASQHRKKEWAAKKLAAALKAHMNKEKEV
ncbi:ANR family transcriptional regulator [Photorhabdus kayaii]|uniref:ANR family transcriptional regulator n=1 Tax=Photorhabdus kayaii TaxID=230088 RepID=UPI0021D4E3A7|nr:ANR family transcriptional regulator [Photorhabdus kayaii]MCT8354199.1 ANR family transcriptional regulator [Photorhabdus kayaii]